ncbi:MAG: phosphoribosylglycinamide formyltransferase, partial [Nitrospirae bacterium]
YHDDTEDSLSERILRQEHRIFPYAIKLFSEGRLKVEGRKVIVDAPRDEQQVLINPPIQD